MSSRSSQLVLVRHGETAWSRSGQHTGRTDVPLLEDGRRMARTLGEALSGWSFARVFSSPLSRAYETCVLAGFGDRVEKRDALMEWDYGEYEGRTGDDIRAERPGWTLWMDGVPGGETPVQLAARVDQVIAEVRAIDGDVALFAHGHVLRVLTARWLGLDVAAGRFFSLATGSISVLCLSRGQPVIVKWNDTTHLAGGAPLGPVE